VPSVNNAPSLRLLVVVLSVVAGSADVISFPGGWAACSSPTSPATWPSSPPTSPPEPRELSRYCCRYRSSSWRSG